MPGLGIGISGGGDFVVLFLGYRRQGVTVAFLMMMILDAARALRIMWGHSLGPPIGL